MLYPHPPCPVPPGQALISCLQTGQAQHCSGQQGARLGLALPSGLVGTASLCQRSGGVALQLAGSGGSQPETPHSCWAQLTCGSEAAMLRYSWRGAAFSPGCSQRSWGEQQGSPPL